MFQPFGFGVAGIKKAKIIINNINHNKQLKSIPNTGEGSEELEGKELRTTEGRPKEKVGLELEKANPFPP